MSFNKIQFHNLAKAPGINRAKCRKWISTLCKENNFKLISINYIFCNDEYLLKINQQYLNHNTLTDIITFDLSNELSEIEGEIYISTERVQENAIKLSVSKSEELLRVVVHGLLHLMGHKDKTKAQKEKMRALEDLAIKEYYAMFHVK